MSRVWRMNLLSLSAFVFWALSLHAQANLVTIDAMEQSTPETPLHGPLGSSRSPSGHSIGATTRYLTFDGKPWLPVMGELHYARVPESEWEAEILRMKSAGVDVISSYVFWIHHEQEEGHFTWTGDRDLRHFAELCAKHGMYFYPRIGPWSHGEARNGGFPDWLIARGHTRENDPHYLASVDRFYRQIGQQLAGLYWKDGGPIIGLQLENEYVATGDGKGADHIHALKKMSVAAGMDVPLYTVTGWGNAAAPADAVLPVFGGYADAPWDDNPKPMPPSEVYAFRFDNRATADMGAMGGATASRTAKSGETPFLAAEIGAGIQDTYFRRPVVSPDDIAAIVPVMLGSGVNLLGYYMFAGGRNPDGGAITLQESQRTGYPTDVPVRSYDFQAPLSNNGEERKSLRRLKLVHYFLQDFGSQLAPMGVHRPARSPSNAEDLSIPRVAARTRGDSGFLFLNNYTRGAVMPARREFQIQLALPGGTMLVPQAPIELPSGAYGIWPINLDLGGVRLRYSTAQLLSRLELVDETCIFFFGLPGVLPEFVVDAEGLPVTTRGFTLSHTLGGVKFRAGAASGEILVRTSGKRLRLVLLPRRDAENLWKVNDGHALLLTTADVYSGGAQTTLRQEGRPVFECGVFHAASVRGTRLPRQNRLFIPYQGSVVAVPLSLKARQTALAPNPAPLKAGPSLSWRKTPIPMAPDDAEFAQAARWIFTLKGKIYAPQLAEAMIHLRYRGDMARLLQSGHLLDDNFWNGEVWTAGAHALKVDTARLVTLQILPLRKDYPMFLQNRPDPLKTNHGNQAAELQTYDLIPVYRWTFTSRPN